MKKITSLLCLLTCLFISGLVVAEENNDQSVIDTQIKSNASSTNDATSDSECKAGQTCIQVIWQDPELKDNPDDAKTPEPQTVQQPQG